jgi:hypothetical protein
MTAVCAPAMSKPLPLHKTRPPKVDPSTVSRAANGLGVFATFFAGRVSKPESYLFATTRCEVNATRNHRS